MEKADEKRTRMLKTEYFGDFPDVEIKLLEEAYREYPELLTVIPVNSADTIPTDL